MQSSRLQTPPPVASWSRDGDVRPSLELCEVVGTVALHSRLRTFFRCRKSGAAALSDKVAVTLP